MRKLELPIVCAVNGVAAGAGANIALAGDVVVAARSASFIQAFSKIGLIPDSGGTYTLPRLIGFQKASALMMLGDKVPAEEAERMGMIYKVFEDGQLEQESLMLAHRLSEMPTLGLALTKAALNESAQNDLNDQLALEDRLQTQVGIPRLQRGDCCIPREKKPPIHRQMIGIAGAGAMGSGIAQVAAQAGEDVLLFDSQPQALVQSQGSIEQGHGPAGRKRQDRLGGKGSHLRAHPVQRGSEFFHTL